MKLEKHVFLSDFQIPNHDLKALNLVYQFLTDFKPDVVHMVGDILDLTALSVFTKDPLHKVTLQDEVELGKKIVAELVSVTRSGKPEAQIFFYSGNHEKRILDYLARNAPELALLEDEEGFLLSIPRLLKLKQLGVEWVEYNEEHMYGGISIEHGDCSREYAQYTAKKMLEKRGVSGVSGHTHRLGLYMMTYMGGVTKWWAEIGSLCKRRWKSGYIKSPNWQKGFMVGHFYNGTMFPTLIPILDNQFEYGGKIYV